MGNKRNHKRKPKKKMRLNLFNWHLSKRIASEDRVDVESDYLGLDISNKDSTTNELEDLVVVSASDTVEDIKEYNISGRRIIDIKHFFTELRNLSSHGEQFGCSLSNMVLIKEICRGLRSGFEFECNMCRVRKTVWSEPDAEDEMDVNTAAVAGVMSTGGGFTSLNHIMSGMNVRSMCSKTYEEYHAKVSKAWEETALEEMTVAAEEEKDIARQRGEVDRDGVPLLTVVADGSWAKRSYRTNYNSLSGVAAIVGYYTTKVLYIGVKNKYCVMCARYRDKPDELPSHTCFKNWNDSSSSMESAAIAEGFLCSLEMHGAKYTKVVADGDSSVYQKILEVRPYDDVTVEKVECRNHLLRNYCNKLKDIATTSVRDQTTTFDKGTHIRMRKIIGSSIMRLRTAVTKAIKYRKQGSESVSMKAVNLRKDIINGPSHVFGEHHRCAVYFCKRKANETNYIPAMKECGLYQKIMETVGALADQSKHLIQDVDSNVVEHYNAAVARLVGGKRVNYCLKGSYQARCAAAVVSYNTGRSQYKLHKKMYGKSPGKFVKVFEERTKRSVLLAKLRRERNPRIRRRLIKKTQKHQSKHYGPLCQKPDLDKELYDEKKKMHLERLNISEENRCVLEQSTRDQTNSDLWREERRIRITASNFGLICNRKPYSNSAPVVSTLLYNFSKDCPATQYGRDHEPEAIAQLTTFLGKTIKPCGLFVDSAIPFLGATPDGLIDDDGIVEVKCPYSGKNLTPEEVIEQKKGEVGTLFTQNKLTNTLDIKKRHKYHFQMQGQMHISKRMYCLFVIWTPLGMKTMKVHRDDNFWRDEMEYKLTTFYMNCLLPELLDPRRRRSMPLREPQYITDAQQTREEKQVLAKPL